MIMGKIKFLKKALISKTVLLILIIGGSFIGIRCSDKNFEQPTDGLKLSITVNGVIGTDLLIANKASTNHSTHVARVSSASATMKAISGFTADVTAEQAPMNADLNDQSAFSSSASTANRANTNKAATQPMVAGHTYRILVYNKNTGKLWNTVQATAGTPISLDVVKGDTYQWYAYSYNNNQVIPEPADLANPSIETAIDKDLLYAKGEVTIANTPANQQDNYNIGITFNHKVAQVHVKIDASILADYADINSFKASFDQNSYLKKGIFDIKGEQISQAEVVPTTTIFTALSPTHIWETSFYTVDPTVLTSYKVVIDDLQVQFKDADPTVAVRNLATYFGESNKPSFTYTFTSPTVGQRLSGVANLWYTLASKRILHVSNNTTFGYSLEQGPSWNFLNALQNFGNLPNSLVKMAPWAAGQGAWTGGNATDDKTENWINFSATTAGDNQIIAKLNPTDQSKKPDIVILGYDVLSIRPTVATALLNYINDKGIVILMMQDNTGNDNKNFFNSLFGVSNIDLSLTGTAGSMYPLEGTDANDIILNGRIGDARGQYWGEDAGTTLGVINAPINQITIYSYGQAINRATTPARVTMFKHKTKNFFFIGDGGFVSYNGGTSSTICPFNYNTTTKLPLPKPYGNAGAGYVANSRSAYNSIIMGNIMLWAARTAEFDGFKPWKYAGAPTP
jgi:hypothetical protein